MDLHRLHGRGWRLGAALLGVALIAGLVPATALAAVGPVFTTQPIGAQYGQPFATQPVVSIKKGANVDTSAGGTVALAIKGGTGTAGATLTCTGTGAGGRTITVVSGIATATGCSIDKAGTAYVLTATWSSGGSDDSATFTISAGPATKLVFTTQPSGGSAGVAWATQPVVTVQDSAGQTVTSGAGSTTNVTLAITPGTGTAGAVLTCTGGLSKAAVSGVASFSGCLIDRGGTGYTLTATGSGLTSATSAAFAISGTTATKLAFTTQPARGTPGGAFATQPVVTIQDAAGATVTTSTATVVLALGANPGGGTLSCTGGLSKAAVNGVAAFSGCAINSVGVGYTLAAASSGLTGATSALFDVADRLVFTTQPAGATPGVAFTTQPVVAVRAGPTNTASHDQATQVTLSIKAGTGAPGAILTCTGGLTKTVVNGLATFAGCSIDRVSPISPANPYQLLATATGLTSATSSPLTVGAPTILTVTPSATVITWGGTVVLTARFGSNGASRTVTLQGARDGVSWATIATLTTDVGGAASLGYRPATNLYYRAVFLGAPDLAAVTSPTTRVVVRQIALLRPTNSGAIKVIRRGTSITFVTTIRPSRPELPAPQATFRLFRRVSGVWLLVSERVVVANSFGQATTTFRFSSTGSWYVRARANPTPYNANSYWSPVERYDVR